jgi:uncharacterized cofD-like protein
VLVASTEEGDTRGQTEVMKSSSIRRIRVEPTNAAAPIAAVEAIERADLILIGPGVALHERPGGLRRPGRHPGARGDGAKKIYVANLHEQIPETEGYTLEDHVDALLRHGIVPDVVLVDHRSSSRTRMFTPRSQSATSRREMAWSTMCKNWLTRFRHVR